jgi:hypothetical protein
VQVEVGPSAKLLLEDGAQLFIDLYGVKLAGSFEKVASQGAAAWPDFDEPVAVRAAGGFRNATQMRLIGKEMLTKFAGQALV